MKGFSMQEEKSEVRRRLLAARTATPGAQRGRADLETWKALRAFMIESVEEGATIAAYRPFGAEPGAALEPELPERLAVVYKVLLPVLLPDKDLAWESIGTVGPQSDHSNEGSAAGSPDPVAPGARPAPEAVASVAAVIVPGLAVSHDGMRLGRGGGSYDRALARVGPEVPVVALLRDDEFGIAVPAEPHDRPVTGVVTPSRGFVSLR